ncbi:alpha/beta fold hydrolase [Tsukamurella pulmonis]|uniref:alpha/beta fold hydrolase n=1 Tax=Tsukamurella pulmonis TaxID=47312 RepID=UPI000E08DB13|nr:alpha/beta hydrolase [Tsukamurella pulmonis]RDH09227.1 alpha/beta hydrolase [Tsukamurella pulmonis]
MYSDDASAILSENHYEIVDDGRPAPVVALAHGAGGGVRENFGPLIDGVSDRRFVGPYWPGSGGTPRTDRPLEIDELADAVVAAAVDAGAERFPVVGLSLGAAIAVTAALRHPEHVSALVLTVGLACADFRVRTATDAIGALAAAGAWDALAAYVLGAASSETTLRALTDEQLERARVEVRDGMPAGAPDQMEVAGRVDVTGLLPRVSVPTLVAVSGGDRLVPVDIGRRFAEIPGARLVEYPDAGHVFTPAEAAVWTADVAEFLRALA